MIEFEHTWVNCVCAQDGMGDGLRKIGSEKRRAGHEWVCLRETC